ncbi:hypothetical protein [Cardinium endosymbiont of Encarsia pergandiella]|uniref:hypothetical protein n=1 Tax=Cardinium endosymbiont of Encarsia pergandiella TaxID=249402 RepID=UPI0004B5867E|nr:hypothetical protein [Cardinium endosymbiont of Encarsia pergandiella]
MASFGVACFDQSTQRPFLMGKKDSKKLKSYAGITNQNNKLLKQNEAQWLDASIEAKQHKSVLTHKYVESDNQLNIDLNRFEQRLDNVSEEMATLDPIASTTTALHSIEGLEKKAKKIENNQEEPIYIEIVDDETTDNDPIYEEIPNTDKEIIETASYYETPRSNGNHQNLSRINENLAQAHKSEAPIYQNRTDTNQDEEPIYEEIDFKREEGNNKSEKVIHQNPSSASKKQDRGFRDFVKKTSEYIKYIR